MFSLSHAPHMGSALDSWSFERPAVDSCSFRGCLYIVQLAFGFFVFPCLLAAYVGQAAYLSQNPLDVQQAFYKSIPGKENTCFCISSIYL
jgi:hypothetical protein